MSFIDKIKINDSPMDYVCEEVTESLKSFISREHEYIYAPDNKRKLFTLSNKADFVHRSLLSIDDYIKSHNLEYEWRRLHIQETFTYKQRKEFQNSKLTLAEFVDKYHLCDKPKKSTPNSRDYTNDTSDEIYDSDVSYDNCEDCESLDSWGDNI